MARCSVIVHYGPPGPERSQKLFEDCLDLYSPTDTAFLYLVATPLRRRQLHRLFLERFPHVFELPIMTFPGWVHSLVKNDPSRPQILDEAQKKGLLAEVLDDADFEVAGHLEHTSGVLPYLCQYISFVKMQNIKDEPMLRLRYEKLGKAVGRMEEDLMRVFSHYQHLLEERGYEDEAGLYDRVYEGLLTGTLKPDSVFPGLRRLVLEGLYTLTPVERGILQILTSEIEEIHFSIDLDSQQRQFDPFSEALQELVEFLEELDALWVFEKTQSSSSPAVFCQTETREKEVVEVAGRIRQLRQSHPELKFTDIALICSQPGDYQAYVEEIFPEWGIPFHWLAGRSAGESKAVATFARYIRLLRGNFHRQHLFDLLGSPWIGIQGLSEENIRLMERLSLQAGIIEGLEQWLVDFPSWIRLYLQEIRREGKDKWADQVDATYPIFLDVIKALNTPREPRPYLDWIRELTLRVEAFFRSTTQGSLSWSRLENLSLTTFLDRVKTAALFWNDRPLSLDRFSALLLRQLSDSRAWVDFDQDAVLAGDKRDFQQCRFRFLFWLGFAEGQFPTPPFQHIFFQETRTSQWEFGNRKRNLAENYYLFNVLKSAASEEICFSCPKRVGEVTYLPSPFLRHLSRVRVEQPSLLSGLRPATPVLDDQVRENVRRGIQIQSLRALPELSIFEGLFSTQEVLAQLRQRFFSDAIEVSPTRLQEYVQCGFQYFLRRVLRVEPVEEIGEEITALEKGRFLHRVLFQFLGNGFEAPLEHTPSIREKWTKKQRRRMAAIVNNEPLTLHLQRRWQNDLFWRHQEKKLVRGLVGKGEGILTRFIDREWERSRYARADRLEASIGPVNLGNCATVPNSKKTHGIPVRLVGSIDRLDRTTEGSFLIDYKTGAKDDRKRVYEGWGFQLPLYVKAAQDALGAKIKGAAFYYIGFPLEVELKELVIGEHDTNSGLEKLVEYYRDKALETTAHLYNGHFPLTLLGQSKAGCQQCGYRHICRLNPGKMEGVKLSRQFPVEEKIVERGRWVKRGRD